MMPLLSIDPGINGALAIFSSETGALQRIEDMPTIAVKVGSKIRKRINAPLLAELFEQAQPTHAFIEKVGTRPGESPVGAFSFGYGAGLLEGIAAGQGVPVTFIQPKTWKRATHTPTDKGGARLRACQLFPLHAASFARIKDDGRAEAALLGFYGLNTIKSTSSPEVTL